MLDVEMNGGFDVTTLLATLLRSITLSYSPVSRLPFLPFLQLHLIQVWYFQPSQTRSIRSQFIKINSNHVLKLANPGFAAAIKPQSLDGAAHIVRLADGSLGAVTYYKQQSQ